MLWVGGERGKAKDILRSNKKLIHLFAPYLFAIIFPLLPLIASSPPTSETTRHIMRARGAFTLFGFLLLAPEKRATKAAAG
jgi:hypothetical protein